MAIAIYDLKIVKSGGAANTDPAACLGGIISSAAESDIVGQSFTAPSTVTGVTILASGSNAIGAGLLKWDATAQVLYWKPYGASTYNGAAIPSSGDYIIGTANGYLLVSVVYASLPALTQQDSITIGYVMNNLYDDISPLESLYGDVEYRCFYIKNTHATLEAPSVAVWIKSQPTGDDEMDLGVDPAGVGNGVTTGVAKTIVDEADSTDVLSSGTPVAFTRPSSAATALAVGSLPAGSCVAVWLRRTIPSESPLLMANDVCSIGISAVLP